MCDIDDSLLKSIKIGDKDAFGKLYSSKFRGIVFIFCRLVLPNFDDAEDATQNSLIKIYLKIKLFKGDTMDEFMKWVFKIARNTSLDILRKKRRNHYQTSEIDDIECVSMEESFVIADLIDSFLEGIDEKERSVLQRKLGYIDFNIKEFQEKYEISRRTYYYIEQKVLVSFERYLDKQINFTNSTNVENKKEEKNEKKR